MLMDSRGIWTGRSNITDCRLKFDPEDDEVYANLGAAYEKKGLFAEALKAYTSAFELNPEATQVARKIPQMKIRILQQKQK